MNTIIVISEDTMFANRPVAVTELADIACAAITGAVQQVREGFPKEEADKIEKDLFDCLNHSFSKCLELAFPEMEMHPEITEEVLKLEEELVAQRAKEMDNVVTFSSGNAADSE